MKTSIFRLFKRVAYIFRGRHLNRFFLVRSVLNLVLHSLKPESMTIDGNKMYLDKGDSMRLSILGVYEPTTVKYFQKSIKKGDTVLDIGAHIGYYTLMAAKRVGKSGRVYAFEPVEDNCSILSKNIEVNKYKNVSVVKKAVGKTSKKAKFYISRVSTGMHSLVDIDGNENITIDIVSLNSFFGNKLPKISVIKMDIEGGEYEALKGMSEILKKDKLSIFTEFSPFSIKKAKKSPRGFLELLSSYGFKLFSINETKKELIPIEIENFIKSCPIDRDWHINILAKKGN